MSDFKDWMESKERPGYRVKHMRYKNVTIEVYRPILSDEERTKRERALMKDIARIAAPYV